MRWRVVLGGALLAWALFIGLMELELAHRGVVPTTPDSEALWIRERVEASRLGERALVLVGASRILLATDLDVLGRQSGLQPVQLAIDGSSFLPVLEGLAADPSFRGSVIVDYADHVIAQGEGDPRSRRYQAAYDASANESLPTFSVVERLLTDAWRRELRSYADGAKPVTALERRILMREAPQYLFMRPDRSRLADYSRIDDTRATLNILRRHGLALPPDIDLPRDEPRIRAAIAAIPPDTPSFAAYESETRRLAREVATLRSRGAKVYFVVLPKTGLVRAIEERQYPRRQFWDRFAVAIGAPAVHFEDVPGLRGFACPDGSHLDFRDRAQFTAALARVLGLERR